MKLSVSTLTAKVAAARERQARDLGKEVEHPSAAISFYDGMGMFVKIVDVYSEVVGATFQGDYVLIDLEGVRFIHFTPYPPGQEKVKLAPVAPGPGGRAS